MSELDTFEASLLAGLREHVATRSPRRPRRRLALTAAAVALLAGAGVLVVPGLGPEPAYSVKEGNADQVEVQVNRPEDATGLERALADHGIPAEVHFEPGGLECSRPGTTYAEGRGIGIEIGRDRLRVTLDPGAVRDGETFVLDVSLVPFEHGARSWVSAEVATGPVTPCV
jgi:hypothetical protein